MLSAVLVAAGWLLSVFHELNRAGYGLALALFAAAVIYWQQRGQWFAVKHFRQSVYKFRKRFRRPAPMMFLVLVLMSLAGGLLYPCTDLDTNAYRTPRVLHWLAAEQWHWIHTADSRLNIAGCNFEWLSAPLVLFTRTDRFIFLINLISYLLLPGLIFDVFTRLRIRPRIAYWWMWFLSAGWCYVMQAGASHNDSFAVIYALASISFALRARESNRIGDVWFSMLSAALLTGAKQTDVPLALLWLIAVWPSIRLSFAKPFATIGVAAASLLVSALPLIYFDLKYTGTWTGLSSNDPLFSKTELRSPVWGIIGNCICLPAQNLLPSYFPFSPAWNQAMKHFLTTPLGEHFASFEYFGRLDQGISEKNAGIGLGICLLALISVWGARCLRRYVAADTGPIPGNYRALYLAPFLLLLLFMAKVGTFQNARQLAPYYVFFFPLLLIQPGHALLVRKRWWHWAGWLTMVMTVGTLFIVRSRPLFPANTILESLAAKHPHSSLISKMLNSYSNRLALESLRDCFKDEIPSDERVVGYATTKGQVETGLWMPFGCRRVERVLPGDTSEELLQEGVKYVVVEDEALFVNNETIEDWMARHNAILVDQYTFKYDPYRNPSTLYLVRLNSNPTTNQRMDSGFNCICRIEPFI
ncbi:MAG TPA: hypothetical protein VMF08_02180 [Candidatus Sulfotelmatobacter sp.]|nr:hypothetical protein [Candidatus Sulfotelmatobacter sp.]